MFIAVIEIAVPRSDCHWPFKDVGCTRFRGQMPGAFLESFHRDVEGFAQFGEQDFFHSGIGLGDQDALNRAAMYLRESAGSILSAGG
jgi:hypothetical protein